MAALRSGTGHLKYALVWYTDQKAEVLMIVMHQNIEDRLINKINF